MVSEWQLECLASRINSLAAEIQRVRAKDHPYEEPRIVYDVLLSALDRRSKVFSDHVRLFRRPEKGKFLEATCETLAIDLHTIAELFSLVDRVDSSRIPFEILRALSWAAEQLVGIKCRVVVRLDPIFNYSIFSTERVVTHYNWHADWVNVIARRDWNYDDILWLGIPSALSGSILVNALAAHEIGHLLFYKQKDALIPIISKIYATVLPDHQSRLQEHIVAEVERAEPLPPTKDIYNTKAGALSLRLQQTALDWCEEVYSDLVGARLLGPAYLAAFDRVLVGKHPPSSSHPPNQLRRDIVKDYIEKTAPKLSIDPVWASLTTSTEHPSWGNNPVWNFEETVCRAIAAPFRETLQTISSPFDEDFEAFSSMVSEMEAHIEHLSPPSVVLRARSQWLDSKGFWAIFYVAWHFRLNKPRFSEFAARYGWDTNLCNAEDALGNLVLQSLKSLELTYQANSGTTSS